MYTYINIKSNIKTSLNDNPGPGHVRGARIEDCADHRGASRGGGFDPVGAGGGQRCRQLPLLHAGPPGKEAPGTEIQIHRH